MAWGNNKMKSNWTTLFVSALAIFAVTGSATAQNAPGRKGNQNTQIGTRGGANHQSNLEMRQAAEKIKKAIHHLRNGLPIYQGHRENAIQASELALVNIGAGLKWNKHFGNNQHAQTVQGSTPQQPASRYTKEQVARSTNQLKEAAEDLVRARNDLQQAQPDYDGYRSKAIQSVNLALQEIDLAIRSLGNR
jgi:hypothetical protein